jgi:hypothetical protein
MRIASKLALVCVAGVSVLSGVALAASVTIDHPTQGETARSGTIAISVTLSPDFEPGREGWVEIWVDGNLTQTLKGTSGTATLSPGNHQIQARLVRLDHQPLRVPTQSEVVTVTVPIVDPQGN